MYSSKAAARKRRNENKRMRANGIIPMLTINPLPSPFKTIPSSSSSSSYNNDGWDDEPYVPPVKKPATQEPQWGDWTLDWDKPRPASPKWGDWNLPINITPNNDKDEKFSAELLPSSKPTKPNYYRTPSTVHIHK